MVGHILIEIAAVAVAAGLWWWGFGPKKDEK